MRMSLVLGFMAAIVAAQVPAELVPKIREEGQAPKSQVMKHLDELVNGIGPRLTGSENLTRACDWAREKFESFGLKARVEPWGEIAVGFDRGPHAGVMFTTDSDGRRKGENLVFGTNAWTPGTDGWTEGASVLAPKVEAEVDAFMKAAKGAWIVARPGAFLRGKSLTDKAVEAGALGIVRDGGENVTTSGNHQTQWEKWPKLPSINVISRQFRAIVTRLEGGESVAFGFNVDNRFKKGPVVVSNVIAEITGTEKPDEYVMIGGHIDSWDGARGTTDNGTGTATTIEAARILAAVGAKPRRTIRFMLWSGEEQGLLGSDAHAEKNRAEMDRISVCLVHDGGTNYLSGIIGIPEMVPIFEEILAPVKDLDPMKPFAIKKVDKLPVAGASDHASYTVRGAPGIFWNQAGVANYGYTWHTQNDVFAAAIPEYQRHSSIVIALSALAIANWPTLLPRGTPAPPNVATARRRLGAQFDRSAKGLVVEEVVEGSRGAAAGLQPQDRIVKVDDTVVDNRDQLSSAINVGGTKKTLTVERGGKTLTLTLDFEPKK